jgi:toxin ParE1/3/4
MKCVFSTFAEVDLEEIGDYIASDNPRRALSFIGEIRERCYNIVVFPEAAPLREEFGVGIRVIPFGRYLIFYTTHPDTVRIERILSGSRLLSNDYFTGP